MKTVDEWIEIFDNRTPDGPSIKELFTSIQQEAYHEGQLAGLKMGKETAMKTIDEVFSKPAERSESV